MLLETLLLSPCFLTGKTSHRDSKTTLCVNKNDIKDDETLLFFDIDDQTNHHGEKKDEKSHRNKIRELFWRKQEGHSLCDLLVFFAKGNERIFCFVELKDNKKDLVTAKNQLISTYDAVRKNIDAKFKFSAKAFICSSGGSLPKEHRSCQDELNRKFKGGFEENGKSADFIGFLRGESNKPVNKGRRR